MFDSGHANELDDRTDVLWKSNGKWYFRDENRAKSFGPFDTEQIAQTELEKYYEELNLSAGGVKGCRTKSVNHSRVYTADKVELGPADRDFLKGKNG